MTTDWDSVLDELSLAVPAGGYRSQVTGYSPEGFGTGSGSDTGFRTPDPGVPVAFLGERGGDPGSRKLLAYGNLSSLRPLPGRCQRRLCGFEREGAEWVATSRVPFRPSALMLWDVPERATISHSVAGNQIQLAVSSAPVPARFFATGHSFEEVVRRFEKEGIDAPYWCDFDTLELGWSFRISVLDEDGKPVERLQAVLLGLAALS